MAVSPFVFLRSHASAASVTVLTGTESFTQSLTVAAGQILRFDPNTNTTVEISGNLVVHGTLEMKPQPGVTHTLRFVGVDESAFVGGGMEVLESDRGLWVMGSGKLDVVGEAKAGWNRLGTDPTWDSSDELVVAPTAPGDYEGFAKFTLGAPVPRADASVPPAEVINLTRSVRIEGMPGARSHVIIMSSVPQNIRYAAFRHMGPRQNAERGGTEGVLGRYPLHFHMAGDGSRGSVVEGNVVRDSGHRAFVPHGSHGITLRENVAYNVMDTPYWWDVGEVTDDSIWEHNFAGSVDANPQSNEHPVLSGFVLGEGAGNVARDNAAAGILGNTNCSGFHWPSQTNGIWEFRVNVAHNIKCSGIFVWQNTPDQHVITDFVAYRNGLAGVNHGAYSNPYVYENLYLFENATAGVINHSFSTGLFGPSPHRQAWSCVTVVGSPIALWVLNSPLADGLPVPFDNFVPIGVSKLVQVNEVALKKGQTVPRRIDWSSIGIPCGGPAPADPFDDDEGSVHEVDIEMLARALITLGCGDRRFCPSSSITRGQMAAFLVRGLGLPPVSTDAFADDGDSIFEDDINRLARWEITKGCGGASFCPSSSVTRGQMAAFLVRALHVPSADEDFFTDDDDSVFEADINALAAAGITKGCSSTAFCPNQPVTRAQMASFLVRALGLS
jgi:hypothetical protein